MTTLVRDPAVAGSFYPDTPARLNAFLDGHLFPPATVRAVRGLIVPHAGYQYSGPTAAEGFSQVPAEGFKRAIVIAPSHRVGFAQIAVAPFRAFRTPLGDFAEDEAACAALAAASPLYRFEARPHFQEHALEVELPFLQRLAPAAQLVPLVCGQLELPAIIAAAKALAPFWDPDTLLVASSDFTHYGEAFDYVPFPRREAGPAIERLDRGAIDRIVAGDPEGFWQYVEKTGATICGRVPIALLLATRRLACPGTMLELLAYTSSGQQCGDYSHSVSYAAIGIFAGGSP